MTHDSTTARADGRETAAVEPASDPLNPRSRVRETTLHTGDTRGRP